MTEQEKFNSDTNKRLSSLEQQVATVASKVDMLIIESQQQREDIRRLNEKHESEMHEMNKRFYDKFGDLTKQINDTWRQTMLGVGGMIVALGALLVALLK